MPKLKTKSGAKKRFKVTGTGKVVSAHAGKRHGMIKRTKKQIRQLRVACQVPLHWSPEMMPRHEPAPFTPASRPPPLAWDAPTET
jgi:ribosomal protein L35